MNVIGEIGNFIIKYQEPIQAGVILLLIIAGIVMIGKLMANGKRKRELLSQINDTVAEINTAVNHLSEKKADVVYIDSRITQDLREPAVEALQTGVEPQTDADPLDSAEETAVESDVAEAQEEASEEKIEPVLKYFSRDCAVSKNGKQFTFEELDAQIKE